MLFNLLALICFAATASAQRRYYSLEDMPETNFDCRDKILGGYYADPEANCQMFHVCVKIPGQGVQDFRFLCPNETAFDQENQICADSGDIDCEAAGLYLENFDLYRIGSAPAKRPLFNTVKGTVVPLGPSTKSPLLTNNINEEDEFYLQRSDTGDRRLHSKDLLRGSSSSNFFNNRNKGKDLEDDDDEEPSPRTPGNNGQFRPRQPNNSQVRGGKTSYNSQFRKQETSAAQPQPTPAQFDNQNQFSNDKKRTKIAVRKLARKRPEDEVAPETKAPAPTFSSFTTQVTQRYNFGDADSRYSTINRVQTTPSPAPTTQQRFQQTFKSSTPAFFEPSATPRSFPADQNKDTNSFLRQPIVATGGNFANRQQQQQQNNYQQTNRATTAPAGNNQQNSFQQNKQQNFQQNNQQSNFQQNNQQNSFQQNNQQNNFQQNNQQNNFQQNNFQQNNQQNFQQNRQNAPAAGNFQQNNRQAQGNFQAQRQNQQSGNINFQGPRAGQQQQQQPNNFQSARTNQPTAPTATPNFQAQRTNQSPAPNNNFQAQRTNQPTQNTQNFQAQRNNQASPSPRPNPTPNAPNFRQTQQPNNNFQGQARTSAGNFQTGRTNPPTNYPTDYSSAQGNINRQTTASLPPNARAQTINNGLLGRSPAPQQGGNRNFYNGQRTGDDFDEGDAQEFLKTAPSNNFRPSDLNSFRTSTKDAPSSAPTSTTKYYTPTIVTTPKPQSTYYTEAPSRYTQPATSQTASQSYQPITRKVQQQAPTTTPRPQQQQSQQPVRTFQQSQPASTKATEVKDTAYDYAYYDEGGAFSEYDSLDSIGETDFSRTSQRSKARLI